MQAWIEQVAYNAPYIVILGVIILSGFGLPLPEDVPLIAAGYLAGRGVVNPWIMFPACVLAILGADFTLFLLGRRYGEHVPKLPVVGRYVTQARLRTAEIELQLHRGKFIFVARFLPGLRAPAMFAAGVCRISAWTFLAYDGLAGMVSVPLILGLAYHFADHIDAVRQWIERSQLGAAGAAGLAAAVAMGVWWWRRRRRRRREAGA